jgi:pSer/pThr/pTyr-binding forkhead associated (FHA) protein
MTGRLLARAGPLADLDFSAREAVRIGSGADADIRLDAPGVLPVHATISRDGDGLRIAAAQAQTAGAVWLNGRRIDSERLQHLDVITLGRAVDLIYLAT